jgi:L-ascorbate metabolism protein UlaG (beta-lactamase superfamily)
VRTTKYTHACVRVEDGGRVLVIDPGEWSEPEALAGADAVLVTHHHSDHVDALRLAGLGAPVYAPAGATIPGVAYEPVAPDAEFEVAGFRVRAFGSRHAHVYGDRPDLPNFGYLVEDRLYHPGDALHVPDRPVETLLVPIQASWLKTAEGIDFMRAVRPTRAHGIHEGQVNERALGSINAWYTGVGGTDYRYLAPGEPA